VAAVAIRPELLDLAGRVHRAASLNQLLPPPSTHRHRQDLTNPAAPLPLGLYASKPRTDHGRTHESWDFAGIGAASAALCNAIECSATYNSAAQDHTIVKRDLFLCSSLDAQSRDPIRDNGQPRAS
jgi:hypothetical protein